MSERPVLACYRGLDSADAVQLGAMLARTLGEPLVIANAFRYEPVYSSARALSHADNDRREQAARVALHRARAFAGADVEIREEAVAATGAADALAWLARDLDAQVMVLGRDTHGHVTRSIVPRAQCAVAVAPLSVPLPPLDRYERVGVAYDGSVSAQRALVTATGLARAMGAELFVLSAGPSIEHAATWLHLARLAIGSQVDFATRACVGDPSTQLAAASADVDLLVCGSRGRSRPLAAVLGSVSTHLITHARCPVLVVPPSAWPTPQGPPRATSAAARS